MTSPDIFDVVGTEKPERCPSCGERPPRIDPCRVYESANDHVGHEAVSLHCPAVFDIPPGEKCPYEPTDPNVFIVYE